MDDILDLERAVLDLTAKRDALADEVRRLRAENEQLRTPMAPMTYGLDDTRALLAAQMRITQHLHEEARKLRAENADLRARVTTGGPPAPFTPGWERGDSSRPPTAPPEPTEVNLP